MICIFESSKNDTMTTLILNSEEAIKKAQELISQEKGFDFFSKNSQYIFDELRTQPFLRVNLFSENCHSYKSKKEFIAQLIKSSKSEKNIEINIF